MYSWIDLLGRYHFHVEIIILVYEFLKLMPNKKLFQVSTHQLWISQTLLNQKWDVSPKCSRALFGKKKF